MSTEYFDIIKKPLITEKGSNHLKENVYSFVVADEATKNQIAKAVEKIFKVKVEKVRTMNSRGHQKRVGRYISKVPHYKKAFVKVAEGQKIKIFEGV